MASEIKPLKEEDITPNQAIDFIGNALANESLKLSQREHLLLVKCYSILKEKINICGCENKAEDKIIPGRNYTKPDKLTKKS